MRAIFTFLFAINCLVSALHAADEPKQILLHEGPDLTTPGLLPKEVLTYRKEFFVSADLLAKQGRFSLPPSQQLPLSAEKAIELAKATVEARDDNGEMNVMRLELLAHGGSGPSNRGNVVLYYFIEFIANGNEVHRAVLMDGSVVKSTLRELKKP